MKISQPLSFSIFVFLHMSVSYGQQGPNQQYSGNVIQIYGEQQPQQVQSAPINISAGGGSFNPNGGMQSIEQSVMYWQSQQSPQQTQTSHYRNEPPSIRPLMIKLDQAKEKFNREMNSGGNRQGAHSANPQTIFYYEAAIKKERNRLKTQANARKQHQNNVVTTINQYLTESFNQAGKLSKVLRVQYALGKITSERELDSQDTVLRNSEYYLHGLYATMSGDVVHIYATEFAAAYDWLKSLELKWINDLLAVDEGNPVSPAGGAQWAYMGLSDGSNNKEGADQEVAPGNHNLKLSIELQ